MLCFHPIADLAFRNTLFFLGFLEIIYKGTSDYQGTVHSGPGEGQCPAVWYASDQAWHMICVSQTLVELMDEVVNYLTAWLCALNLFCICF